MELWIPVTFLAAAVQTLRFMLQRHLAAATLSAAGATLSRFLYSAPLAGACLALYLALSGQGLPVPLPGFWAYAVLGGLAQILATVFTVMLFKHRNFAVGITFKKTEVILSAVVGFLLLGDVLGPWAWLAIAVGLVGVLLLSDPPQGGSLFNRAAGLGLMAGLAFAFAGVGYRGVVLHLDGGDALLRALTGLLAVTVLQTFSLGLWLIWREPGQVRRVLGSWRVSSLVGLTSMIGSASWFVAFTMQSAALVFAVGQVELIFSALAALFVFGERISRREWLGMAVLCASILLLIFTR